MSLDEEVLELVAKDGTMDYDKWPGLLDPLLERLDHIVHNDFPIPIVPPALSNTFDTPSLISSSYPTQEVNSQTNSNKENAPPSQLQTPPRRPPVPAFPSSASSERIPDSQSGPTDDTIPPPLVAMLSSIKSTLRSYFSAKPPHTIQRLAELILRPTRHYRTLPAYLRAVDRVVSVSSGADIFPLPLSIPLPGGMVDNSLVNGVNGVGGSGLVFSDNNALGSDESLGGALLTPIPWLSNSSLPGGNDDGSFVESDASPNTSPGASSPNSSSPSSAVPPRESGAVTQGELIRQEQEAGVVPTTMHHQHQRQHQPAPALVAEGEQADAQGDDVEDVPHARGPTILGVEDMGLQDGRGVQMSLSTSPPTVGTVSSDSTTEAGNNPSQSSAEDAKMGNEDVKDDGDRDADGDIVIGDIPDKLDQTGAATTALSSEDSKLKIDDSVTGSETDAGNKEGNDINGSDNGSMDT
ncbi:hypothetical protein AJ79_04758 [Helicocarpus griseus UAMH5409]|uniref:Protein phosphatase 4 core regulatory subunit R2 n=1 Tax=Helicocarpus griseus UAMH5409 TaxID=1447875 RepID=A0A2B7XSP3_9EURO|nr:hypothetical protein AJ79_04758 [Helicocarpus griseus UAMH5409]